jgi:hypothetical protein
VKVLNTLKHTCMEEQEEEGKIEPLQMDELYSEL